jgi:hypothetical protein
MQNALDMLLNPSVLFGGFVVVAVLAVVWKLLLPLLARKKKKDGLIDDERLVDLSELPRQGDGAAGLRVQNVPGRLGVVVFAPLGSAKPPSEGDAFAVLGRVVPGLGKIFRRDEPLVQIWPKQVSVTGFANTLARHLHVPGRDLTETRWCLLVGKTKRPDGVLLVGLAVGMEIPNRLGVIRLADEMQWLQFVQVDTAAS